MRYSSNPQPLFDAKSTSVDKMFIFERLSRLEKEAGNVKAADDYMKSAVQTCGNTGWKDCSIEKIIKISRKMEEKSLVPPKPTKTNDINTKH